MLDEMSDSALAISHKFPVTDWVPIATVAHGDNEEEELTTGRLYLYDVGVERRRQQLGQQGQQQELGQQHTGGIAGDHME